MRKLLKNHGVTPATIGLPGPIFHYIDGAADDEDETAENWLEQND